MVIQWNPDSPICVPKVTYVHTILVTDDIVVEQIVKFYQKSGRKVCRFTTVLLKLVYSRLDSGMNISRLIDCFINLDKPGTKVKLTACGNFNIKILQANIKLNDWLTPYVRLELIISESAQFTHSTRTSIDNIAVSNEMLSYSSSKVIPNAHSLTNSKIITIQGRLGEENVGNTLYHRQMTQNNYERF